MLSFAVFSQLCAFSFDYDSGIIEENNAVGMGWNTSFAGDKEGRYG